MNEKTFKSGSLSFSDWWKENNDAEVLVLEGCIFVSDMILLDEFLLNSHIKLLKLKDFQLDKVKEHEFSLGFFKHLCYHKFDSIFCDYIDVLKHSLTEKKILPIDKIILNSINISSFKIDNNLIFSEDLKTLIHILERENLIIPEGIECVGIAACSCYENTKSISFSASLKIISEYAFAGIDDVEEIYIPDTVQVLKRCAFELNNFEKIRLSKNLLEIPDNCFEYCDVENLTIPSKIKRIGNCALKGAQIETLEIPEGVEEIGGGNFGEPLKYIYLPSTLKEIAHDFYCEELVDSWEFHPPYIEINPNNPKFYSKNGTLYLRENDKMVLKYPYHKKVFEKAEFQVIFDILRKRFVNEFDEYLKSQQEYLLSVISDLSNCCFYYLKDHYGITQNDSKSEEKYKLIETIIMHLGNQIIRDFCKGSIFPISLATLYSEVYPEEQDKTWKMINADPVDIIKFKLDKFDDFFYYVLPKISKKSFAKLCSSYPVYEKLIDDALDEFMGGFENVLISPALDKLKNMLSEFEEKIKQLKDLL